MTEAISREDVIAWVDRWVKNAGMRSAIISYLRPPPADDGVIGRIDKFAAKVDVAFISALSDAYGHEGGFQYTVARLSDDLRILVALARQAGATGEHPVSVVAPCPRDITPEWPDAGTQHRVWEAIVETVGALLPGRAWSSDPILTAIWTALKAAPPPPVQLSGNPGEDSIVPTVVADRPPADGTGAETSDWIEWTGGECPVPGRHVSIKYRLDHIVEGPGRADDLRWNHIAGVNGMGGWGDIIAYRVAAAGVDAAPPSDAVAELVAACEPFRRAASIRATMTGRGEQTRERFPGDDEVYPAGPITWGMLRRLAAAVAKLEGPAS